MELGLLKVPSSPYQVDSIPLYRALGKKSGTFSCTRIFVEFTLSIIIVTLLLSITICNPWNETWLLKLTRIRKFILNLLPVVGIENYYYNLL